MARTSVLNKEQIVEAAYDLLNEGGIDKVTIRSIATKLGKSTAPIYTQYDGFDAIYEDLKLLVGKRVYTYTQRQWTPDAFLDIGAGLIAFTLENKLIFRHFLLNGEAYITGFQSMNSAYLKKMKTLPLLALFDDAILLELLDTMSTYTFGLATTICTDTEPSADLNVYIEKLARTGNQLIHYHLLTSGQYENFMAYLGKMLHDQPTGG